MTNRTAASRRCAVPESNRLHVMIRRKIAADLDSWIDHACASLVASFANGVAKDIAAIRAAIISQRSNGQFSVSAHTTKPPLNGG